jgi:hypothetical protein
MQVIYYDEDDFKKLSDNIKEWLSRWGDDEEYSNLEAMYDAAKLLGTLDSILDSMQNKVA